MLRDDIDFGTCVVNWLKSVFDWRFSVHIWYYSFDTSNTIFQHLKQSTRFSKFKIQSDNRFSLPRILQWTAMRWKIPRKRNFPIFRFSMDFVFIIFFLRSENFLFGRQYLMVVDEGVFPNENFALYEGIFGVNRERILIFIFSRLYQSNFSKNLTFNDFSSFLMLEQSFCLVIEKS